MVEIVYILCALTSLLCAFLLLRSAFTNRSPLIFWSAIAFIGLALNNIILFVDVVLLPTVDLSIWRLIPAVIGLGALIYGLVKEVF